MTTHLPAEQRRGWRDGTREEWMAKARDVKVTVCSNCLCASCWQGEFYCEKAKSAGTVEITLGEALDAAREHSCWLLRDENVKHVMQHGVEQS